MVEWWVWWRFESERFLLLFVLAPDPAFRSLGGNLKTSHVSSSNFKFYTLKERGESSKFQKPLGFANAQNSSKKIPGTPQQFGKILFIFSEHSETLLRASCFTFNCNNQMRHELNQTKRWVFQLHQSKGKKVRLIWDDRCWMADWLQR